MVRVRPSGYCGAQSFMVQIGSTGRKKTGSMTRAAITINRRSALRNVPHQYATMASSADGGGAARAAPTSSSESAADGRRDLFDLLLARTLHGGDGRARWSDLDVSLLSLIHI